MGEQGAGSSVLPLCAAAHQFWRTVSMCRLHLCFVPVILTHLIESQACGSQESQGIGPEPQLRTTDRAYRWSLWSTRLR